MKKKSSGQISIGILMGVFGLITSIAAPIIYIGGIKEVNAVQQAEINTLKTTMTKVETKLESIATKDDLDRLYKQQEAILKSLRSNPNY